ncbi:hypothetical protein RY27_16945 [Litorilinea aerophila]|nr:hypothetical protein RY27_16945 [Litorilinea aerophila]
MSTQQPPNRDPRAESPEKDFQSGPKGVPEDSFEEGSFEDLGQDPDQDPYVEYARQFDPDWAAAMEDARPRRRKARKSRQQIVAELAEEAAGLEAGFHITYRPARYEATWLLESLRPFYDQGVLRDVLAQIKGGKEASVYRCQADPSTGLELVAAKVYRPRQFRNLRNDKIYREGRQILKADGRPAKKNDHRMMRALQKKTDFGAQVAHTSWLMYEYTTLEQLYQAGASVPRPLAVAENAILMGYIGDERRAAPTLHETVLTADEAPRLFAETLRNVELMLEYGFIHGDLSAYNILYWEGQITLIDFPQVTSLHANSNARSILRRDVERICDYFARYGLDANPQELAASLWQRYTRITPNDLLADYSRHEAEEET